ncbi:MAG: hypothetical protein JNL57_09935 [Bacteroidetes bacterium]|nr:hypothetical protein [Bacteroidota bacterium]
MKTHNWTIASLLIIIISSCGVKKSYLTGDIRTTIESGGVNLMAIQYYVDRDVELRRELSSGETKVAGGKVKFENGKYIHIIRLKKYTPGVCTKAYPGSLQISFEADDGKYLTFGIESSGGGTSKIYQLYAQEWVKSGINIGTGKINYDKQTYYVQPSGTDAKIMIKKSIAMKKKVKKRTMKGRKV